MGKRNRGKKKNKSKGRNKAKKSSNYVVETVDLEEEEDKENQSFDAEEEVLDSSKMNSTDACAGLVENTTDSVRSTGQDFPAATRPAQTDDSQISSGFTASELESSACQFATQLTATVFVAAPLFKDKELAIIGEDDVLGKWKKPQGHFQLLNNKIYQDICIYKGIVPVPLKPGSSFKFVHVDSKGNLTYEGCDSSDNRTEDLLPDCWNFFVFKETNKSSPGFWNYLMTRQISSSSESRKLIASEFFRISFDHVMGSVIPDWDSAFEVVNDHYQKIRHATGEFIAPDGFRQFINQQLEQKDVSFDHLLLLVIGASQMSVNSQKLKEEMERRNREFSLYLHRFRKFQRRNREFQEILKLIAIHGGRNFHWILFHKPESLWNFDPKEAKELSESVLRTLNKIPEVLLNESEVASRVINYLVHWTDIDLLYAKLCPILEKNANYQHLLDPLLLKALTANKMDMDGLSNALCSNFMKKMNEQGSVFYHSIIKSLFDQRKISDVMTLAFRTPSYLLPIVTPVVEDVVSKKLENQPNWNEDDYRFFAFLKDDRLSNFCKVKEQIESKLLDVTRRHAKSGSFQAIPTLKLILFALTEQNVPFLQRPSIVDLQLALRSLPRKYFHNLLSALQLRGSSVDKVLELFRNGSTKQVVESVMKHFQCLEEILGKVKILGFPLVELDCLRDPQVLDCLKSIGLTDEQIKKLGERMEAIKKKHINYGVVYSRFSRLKIATRQQPAEDTERVEADENQEDQDNEEAATEPKIIQVFDPQLWEKYLEETDSNQSLLTLKNALDLQVPLESSRAVWLLKFRDCPLFMSKVWHPLVESTGRTPFSQKDLEDFISEFCAVRWNNLARIVADGSISFGQMEEIATLQPVADLLWKNHFNGKPVQGVGAAYRDFKYIQELQHLVCPFVVALRFFSIKEKDPIDRLYRSIVKKNLLKYEDDTTLAQVTQTVIVKVLKDQLDIDANQEISRDAMKFLSSLVTDGKSPLIQWLKNKSEKEMEAMGKILQGNLLEAYGQLQTLRTRTASFIHNEYKTHKELLRDVQGSESRFSSISGRIQPIDCQWLVNMLPEIEAAIRASVISPSEDAKQKLSKLGHVCIVPKNDVYSIEVHLKPKGFITMEELIQSFQLLDMAAVDESVHSSPDDVIGRTRQYVAQIESLSQVFELLFASGCVTFTFRDRMTIELVDLQVVVDRMRRELQQWNQKWKELEKLPLLSVFSPSYLLQLADLIGRNRTDHVVSILAFVLPCKQLILEKIVDWLCEQAPRIGDNSWLSTDEIFEILHLLHAVIDKVFHLPAPQVQLPPFLALYGRTLNSYFIEKSVVILNVPLELLVGSSLAAYISLTHRPIEPSRILFVTADTDKQEIERFMRLWSVADMQDCFIIVHVERLAAAEANAVRDCVDRVLPEKRAKLLLLSQHNHQVQSTKSLGARLGLISDRLLETNFTADQLRRYFLTILPNAANLRFFTSNLPGCGKSQQAMVAASRQSSDYYRITVRTGSIEELLSNLKKIENFKRSVFLHLDVAHSVSLELNDILLSLLVHGALFDPKNAKLGFWNMSPETTIALEFPSPFGVEQFPIIAYLGKHDVCECNDAAFTYQLAEMPLVLGQPVGVNRCNSLIVASKFLQLKQDGEGGLRQWDQLCASPETILIDPLPENLCFELLVAAFQLHEENPTFSALNAMASFLQRHVSAMMNSTWFNGCAVYLFDCENLTRRFKLDVFDLLLKVANDSVARCWSVVGNGEKLDGMDWTERQRAMFLLGLDQDGNVTGMNIVGRDGTALRRMFHPTLLPILELQCLRFQELGGFRNLMETQEGAQVIVNAVRSLLLLDGTATSAAKVFQLDNHPNNVPASQRLRELIGEEQGYVLTGDNLTEMMFVRSSGDYFWRSRRG